MGGGAADADQPRCELTDRIALDAVVDDDGHVYEREAIAAELAANGGVSPFGGAPLAAEDLHDHPAQPKVKAMLVNHTGRDAEFLIQVKPPKEGERKPVHVCCVIDVSGSMQSSADVKNANGQTERSGLSYLDIVKHAVRTIMASLDENDMISLVSFTNVVKVVQSPVKMTDEARTAADAALSALHPLSSTDLWGGLKKGLDLVNEAQNALGGDDGAEHAVFLLTDGQPNVDPPGGYIPALRNYLDSHKVRCSVNMFGFGYSLATDLLSRYSDMGHGSFAFIPDAGMVGTVFIHALANLRASYGICGTLALETGRGVHLAAQNQVVEHYTAPKEDAASGSTGFVNRMARSMRLSRLPTSVTLNIGTLSLSQTRSFIVKLAVGSNSTPSEAWLDGAVSFESASGPRKIRMQTIVSPATQEVQDQAALARARLEVLGVLQGAISAWAVSDRAPVLREAKTRTTALVAKLASVQVVDERVSQQLEDLIADLEGQVLEAVEPNAFNSWGINYLPSLRFAHRNEACNNFKDPGVQHYGEAEPFISLREEAEQAFTKLDPPKPSLSTFGAAPLTQAHMASLYLNAANGCIAGDCQVALADGSRVAMADLRAGARVQCREGRAATVRCVVRTELDPAEPTPMVRLPGGAALTPYHPVRDASADGRWAFPCDLAPTSPEPLAAVFNLVLDGEHEVDVDGTWCVTLGHGLRGPVVEHGYFGSDRVVADLAAQPGWAAGEVRLARDAFERDPATNTICGLRRPSE